MSICRFPVFILCAAGLLFAPTMIFATENATPDKNAPEAARLVKVLNSDADTYDKAMACRRLAAIGDASAATAIAKFLGDEKLATYARSALENIPDQAAGKALRDALKTVKGNLLVGVINSISKRKDKRAVKDLSPLLSAKNTNVAIAAAHALGEIGTPEAAQALQAALGKGDAKLQREVGFACLMCAKSLAEAKDSKTAVALTTAVRNAKLPENIKLAATQQAIVLQGKAGLELLTEQLKSGDLQRFRAGLQAAQKLGKISTSTLIETYPRLPEERKALLVAAMGTIHDPVALPTVIKATSGDSQELKLQAIFALGELSPAANDKLKTQALDNLLALVKQKDADLAGAAESVIVKLNSSQPSAKIEKQIDANIRKLLESETREQQLAGIKLAGACRLSSSTPVLLQLVNHSNPEVKQTAISALGGTTSLNDLPTLIKLALTSGPDSPASQALIAACSRLPLEETAQALAGAMAGATNDQKLILLDQLAAIGGKTALDTVVAAARSNDDALQNKATDLLGKWVTIDVAPPLLELAKTLENNKYKIRSLRGYIRVARQLNMTPEARLEVCRNTLAIAERNDEKKLVFEVLRRNPTPQAVNYTVSLLKDKTLNVPASGTIVSWAEQGTPIDNDLLADALQRVIASTSNKSLKQRASQQHKRISAQAKQSDKELGFQSLFDGKTFSGWHGNEEIFHIENGEIIAGSLTEKVERNEFLRSNKEYDDFELKLEFKLLGEKTNAGVQIRTAEIPDHHEVSGYQADLGTGYWGCLYDESRRKKILAGPPAELRDLPVRMNDWNNYRIRCEGPRIRIWINDVQTVDFTEADPQIPLKGIIALQIHGNLVNEAHYRNVRVREL
ncbi:family 16 glycoside hydrolase [Gimesia algae]|uniref:HEAT repeat protein n=1 Tax=Gimesia algae TaxID=2527971 RepID=A0A517VM90_9PLAN|nr:family 16 glycoside hydrolase [Gimesia algae]QDT94126.1 HEAT repeat protein [Gimesia algae]